MYKRQAYYRWGVYIDLNKDQEVSFFATTQGKEILADTGKGMEPFEIRGVDMGVGIPGYFSTEFAIDKETYLRWFGIDVYKRQGQSCPCG